MEVQEISLEEWKIKKSAKRAQFVALQQLPYDVKIRKAEQRAIEFVHELEKMDLNYHVSVGGLDSLVLKKFLEEIGINLPAISVSVLEDKSIQRVHDQEKIIRLIPSKSKVSVLREKGFPVISKKTAGKIETLQNPTPRNKTVRHAILTGDCGAQGHFSKDSSMRLAQVWLKLFAGNYNEQYGTDYKCADFCVSNKCCYYLKEKPCDQWGKKEKSYPFLGLMASEGGQREDALMQNGCNYFGKTVIRSAPFATFMRQDLLQLALDLNVTVPEIYGEILKKEDGTLYTTKAQRTGCEICGFGVHMEKRPHRFDRLRERDAKQWEFWMYKCIKVKDNFGRCTGETYGWGKVLDYIGVEWEDIPGGD